MNAGSTSPRRQCHDPVDKQEARPRRKSKRLFATLIVVSLATTSCNVSDSSQDPGSVESLVAAVASYDIVAGRPARFMVGLYTADQTRLLAYGTVAFSFTFLGTGDGTDITESVTGPVTASYLPIPGQELEVETDARPQLVAGSEATGVYGAPDVDFDRAGFWEAGIEVELEGGTQSTTAAFEVLARSDIPAPGDKAPPTRQPLAGDPDVDPKAIDSRAGSDRAIPDPELHDTTVADAIAAGRPVMVVVSTPTFCVSRFCGPITDSVHQLALRVGDRMSFIHLEVWQDFEANVVNPAAAEWIAPTPETDGREPWVFVIDANGMITQRFDNVATDAELLAAVESLLGEPVDS